jgi:hypothetical protein
LSFSFYLNLGFGWVGGERVAADQERPPIHFDSVELSAGQQIIKSAGWYLQKTGDGFLG